MSSGAQVSLYPMSAPLIGPPDILLATASQVFCRLGDTEGHVTFDITVSANSRRKPEIER
ncbi:hypothetical protein [Rhizobium lentis]|uniref:Uncharacterized protein n=1 Tax=Rhizobium lentis TaxID=1138194 RepID=A0ABS7IG20_9HYPH|nr:hypothetical protein [Rhizobium lentis]MBX5090803.1 hypothetical protein [Rhizobium lentis]